MSYWRSCLLISCILLSGCALRTANRAHSSPAPASSGHYQTYTYSAPRDTSPNVHQAEVRPTPVTHSSHVALLTPRLQGIYQTNPIFESRNAPASKANNRPDESSRDAKAIVAQPSGSNTPPPIPSQQVVAANLFPIEGPSYAGPLTAVIILGALIYYALYRIAGSGRQVAPTQALEGSTGFRGEYQPPGRAPGSGSTSQDTQTSNKIRMGSEEAEGPTDGKSLSEPPRESERPRQTKTDSSGPPNVNRYDSDVNKPGETRHETSSSGNTRNDSTDPPINYRYEASGQKTQETLHETTLFGNLGKDSASEPIGFQYDKDGKRVEKSETKTEFFGGTALDAKGNRVQEFRAKE